MRGGARDRYAVAPPSTGSATPVTYDASSETRNSAAAAISSGRAKRPSGGRAGADSATLIDFENARRRGVSVPPGQMQLTRTPDGASSRASERVSRITPAFDAQYASFIAWLWSPDWDATFRMTPRPLRRRC